jgi:hypothetical protein
MGDAARAAQLLEDVLPTGAGGRMKQITRRAVRCRTRGRRPLGPTGCSGGRCWATASKNSSGIWAVATALVLDVQGYRPMAQNLCQRGFVRSC